MTPNSDFPKFPFEDDPSSKDSSSSEENTPGSTEDFFSDLEMNQQENETSSPEFSDMFSLSEEGEISENAQDDILLEDTQNDSEEVQKEEEFLEETDDFSGVPQEETEKDETAGISEEEDILEDSDPETVTSSVELGEMTFSVSESSEMTGKVLIGEAGDEGSFVLHHALEPNEQVEIIHVAHENAPEEFMPMEDASPEHGGIFTLSSGNHALPEPVEGGFRFDGNINGTTDSLKDSEKPQIHDRRVRCPGCEQEYLLSELIDAETGEALILTSLLPQEEVQEYSLAGDFTSGEGFGAAGGMDFGGSAATSGKVRTPLKKAAPRKKRSAVKEIISVVLGGLLALPIVHVLLLVIKGDERNIPKMPTPFFQETYYHVNDESWKWFPTFLLPWYDPAVHTSADYKANRDAQTDIQMNEELAEEELPDAEGMDETQENLPNGGEELVPEGAGAVMEDNMETEEEDISLEPGSGGTWEEELEDTPDSGMEISEESVENEQNILPDSEIPAEIPSDQGNTTENTQGNTTEKTGITQRIYHEKELEKAVKTIPERLTLKTVDQLNVLAEALTFYQSVPGGNPSEKASTDFFKKILASGKTREALNNITLEKLAPEHNGLGVFFAGTIKSKELLPSGELLRVEISGKEAKTVTVFHKENSGLKEGNLYLFTGVIVDPSQETFSEDLSEPVIIWRGVAEEIK
ncbi:MAG: hypothetical protein Q4C96_02550 [Planctomycetia bacterium]|nr:hypothetical protein [Planctomycetia bacterium]